MDMIFSNRDISQAIDATLETLAQVEGQFVCNPNDFRADLEAFIDDGGAQSGEKLPWSKADDVQRLRPGELSVWAGVNGHGKSNILGQVMLWRMQNQKVLIASLEMKPHQTLYRMICQYAGCQASRDFAMKILDKFTGRLWIYDQLDTVKANRIIALIHYAAKELKVDHIVIDSLMKCGLGSGDYDAEKKFIDRLQWAAKSSGAHIHLVCHARKGKTETDHLDKFDIKGGSELSDIPDNIFLIQRNKIRETAMKRQSQGVAECHLSAPEQKALKEPDAWLRIAKNRHGGEEAMLGLYFHKASGQYIPSMSTFAMPAPF